jgi:plastocyanin
MISDKNISVKSLAIGTLSIVITGLALACISTSQLLNTADRVQAQEQERSTAAIRVAAGGGMLQHHGQFVPQRVEIKAGESITWHNPTEDAAEPHTVTFVLDNNTMAGVISPLGVSNMTKFSALPPGSNNEPVLLPDMTGSGMNTIVAINARTYEPVVIDTQGNVTFMKPNATIQ